jgi:hypothetical protein
LKIKSSISSKSPKSSFLLNRYKLFASLAHAGLNRIDITVFLILPIYLYFKIILYFYCMKKCIVVIVFILIFRFSFATIPQGYYTTFNGKQSAAYKTELHNIHMQDTSLNYSYGSGNSVFINSNL